MFDKLIGILSEKSLNKFEIFLNTKWIFTGKYEFAFLSHVQVQIIFFGTNQNSHWLEVTTHVMFFEISQDSDGVVEHESDRIPIKDCPVCIFFFTSLYHVVWTSQKNHVDGKHLKDNLHCVFKPIKMNKGLVKMKWHNSLQRSPIEYLSKQALTEL